MDKKIENDFYADRVTFENAFEFYWYKMKPLSKRLTDDMSGEQEVCALFYQTLKEMGKLK